MSIYILSLYLMSIVRAGNTVCDLSVHRLENLENTDGGSSVMTLLNKINFPSYKVKLINRQYSLYLSFIELHI